jgi:DNA-binding transcriptional LysR family regulator
MKDISLNSLGAPIHRPVDDFGTSIMSGEPPALSIDTQHILVLIEVAAAGSFSEAARRLNCSQSTISNSIAHLERQLGLVLFDRAVRPPVLTDAGRALIGDARGVASRLSMMQARARNLARGWEGEIGLAIDQMYPVSFVVEAVSAFHTVFPMVDLHIYTDALGGVTQLVLDKVCSVGVAYAAPGKMEKLRYRAMGKFELIPVASAAHPLARREGPIAKDVLRDFLQISSGDRSGIMEELMPVIQPKWRVSGFELMYSLIRLGLGWGILPSYKIESDLASRRLIKLDIENLGDIGFTFTGLYRADTLPGPGARWLLSRLSRLLELQPSD